MLDRTSIYSRLILCLLLSLAVHGGAVYLGWLKVPVPLAAQNPVEVAFLPVVEVAQPVAEKVIEERPEPEKQVEPEPHKKLVPKPEPKPKVKREKKKEEVVDAPVAEPDAVELVEEHVVADKSTINVHDENVRAVKEPEVAVGSVAKEQTSNNVSGPVVVDAVPRYSSNPLPEYPHLARQRHWEGVVWLLVDVSADGSVDDLVIEESSGYKVLDRAATWSVSRWRFEPATRAGIPVSSKARVPVRFRLEGR